MQQRLIIYWEICLSDDESMSFPTVDCFFSPLLICVLYLLRNAVGCVSISANAHTYLRPQMRPSLSTNRRYMFGSQTTSVLAPPIAALLTKYQQKLNIKEYCIIMCDVRAVFYWELFPLIVGTSVLRCSFYQNGKQKQKTVKLCSELVHLFSRHHTKNGNKLEQWRVRKHSFRSPTAAFTYIWSTFGFLKINKKLTLKTEFYSYLSSLMFSSCCVKCFRFFVWST